MSNWQPTLERIHGPLYLSIADQIVRAIEHGELTPGARLPTHRELAGRLGVSIHTVSQAYAEVERRGLVIGEIGRGTFVRAAATELEPRYMMDRRSDSLIDLSINRPVYDRIHAERIRAAFAQMADAADLSAMLACRPIAGLDAHRAAGAAWLRRRGIEVGPERILLSNGTAHGMLVALATLTRPGDLVLCESLVDHGLLGLAEVLHFRLQGLAIDGEGIVPEALEAACAAHEVRALAVTPCFNNPTVAMMGEARRRRIAAIAARFAIPIVENDVYGLLAPDAPAALWTHAPDQTCYVTSLTKTVVSGLRTGYLVAPAAMVPRLVRRVRASSWMATPLVAEMASRWIGDGTADELVNWQRHELAARHRIVSEVLGSFDHVGDPHALHVWLRLPEPWRADAFVSEARLKNVAVTPAAPFAVGRKAPPEAVRISVGAARTREQLREGLLIIADLLDRAPEPFYMPT